MLYLYGFGYTATGMGCTGPILTGLMLTAFSAGGFGAAVTAFGIFALTMTLLMLLVSGLVTASQQRLITRLQAAAPASSQLQPSCWWWSGCSTCSRWRGSSCSCAGSSPEEFSW